MHLCHKLKFKNPFIRFIVPNVNNGINHFLHIEHIKYIAPFAKFTVCVRAFLTFFAVFFVWFRANERAQIRLFTRTPGMVSIKLRVCIN